MVDVGSDGSEEFVWDSDDEAVSAPGNPDAPGSSASGAAARKVVNGKGSKAAPPALVGHFVAMGFDEDKILKAIKDNGEGDTEAILELLLTYQVIGEDPSMKNCSESGRISQNSDDDFENWDDETGGNINGDPDSDDFDDEDFIAEMSQKDKKLKSLVEMGFTADEASLAMDRCGQDASVSVLADSIYAAQTAGEHGCNGNLSDDEHTGRYGYSSFGENKRRKFLEENKRKRKRHGDHDRGQLEGRGLSNGYHDEPMPLPNPMVGYSLPNNRQTRAVNRRLPEQAIGPPFFYYENVALAPKGVWATISRFLYDIEPEFVDSKFFCAAARKRGYIHNLPLENRFPLLPLPPKTINEAFPLTKKWWPSWDPRRQFNCLQTCYASARTTERIRCALANCDGTPPLRVQKYVLDECRKWNLVWVGLHKVAPLEPDEIEFLLGFPRNHTRGVGRTERYKSLGNSFQVDTVAYHLSVLKDMFPNGMNVLSLFSGIGGAEVALHRLGIHMKTVVSVEISEVNRNILRSWWDQTNQTGTLIEIPDVQNVSAERLESLIRRFGGFDLVIGGSPCNNLAGSNRHHRDGLEGEHSALFYHYFRILDIVKSTMARS